MPDPPNHHHPSSGHGSARGGDHNLTALPAATAMASAPEPDPEIKAAEWSVLGHMNRVRDRQGLKPLRMATRVRLVARDRSRTMKNQDYFAHVSPAGATAASMLNDIGVSYSSWGENIGWTKYMGNEEGARWMVDWWKNSPPHRRNMLNGDFNYVGIGMAREGAKLLYTVVFVTQRDHTPPKAGLISADTGMSVAALSSTKVVTIRWWGKDRTLAARSSASAASPSSTRRVGRAGAGYAR